jgi:hypothetical protein
MDYLRNLLQLQRWYIVDGLMIVMISSELLGRTWFRRVILSLHSPDEPEKSSASFKRVSIPTEIAT